jgi:hypothetical protein
MSLERIASIDQKTGDIFFCTCLGEGVIVRRDDEYVFLSLWAYKDNVSLRWRFRQAWDALRGRPCAEVVITPETASLLGKHLQDAK